MNKIIIILQFLCLALKLFAMEDHDLVGDELLRIYFDGNTENCHNMKILTNNTMAYLGNDHPKKAALISTANIIFNVFLKEKNLTNIIDDNHVYIYNKFILIIPKSKLNFYRKIFAIDNLELIDQDSLAKYLAYHKTDIVRKEVDIKAFTDLLRDKIAEDEEVISLPILIFGHGGYHIKNGGEEYIAGLLVKDFRSLLLSFTHTILKPQFLIYETCYAGSQHLLLPYYDDQGQALRFNFDIISANPYAIPTSTISEETYNLYNDKEVLDEHYLGLANKMCAGSDVLCLREANKDVFLYFDKDGYIINDEQIIGDVISKNTKLEFLNKSYFYGYIGSNMLYFINNFDAYSYNNNLYDIVCNIITDRGYIDFGLFIKHMSIKIKDNAASSYLPYDIALGVKLLTGKEYQLKNVVIILKNKQEIKLVAQVPNILTVVRKIPLGRDKFMNKKFDSFSYDEDKYILLSKENDHQSICEITKQEYIDHVRKLLKEFILKTPNFLLDYSRNQISDLENLLLLILANTDDDELMAKILAMLDEYKTK